MSSADAAPDVVARYFEMWNTGNSSMAIEIISADWVDHAHPEVTGPEGVRQAVGKIHAARPDLRFHIEDILVGDLVAAVGRVGTSTDDGRRGSRLIWLFRLDHGRMAEMWTYRDTTTAPSTDT